MEVVYPKAQRIDFVLSAPGALRFATNGAFTPEELLFALEVLKDGILEQVKTAGKIRAVIAPDLLEKLQPKR